MIAILVERASASSIAKKQNIYLILDKKNNSLIFFYLQCVVNTIEDLFLSVEILEITSHINLLASGSIPVEGSSLKKKKLKVIE